jgi:hypothetical protein
LGLHAQADKEAKNQFRRQNKKTLIKLSFSHIFLVCYNANHPIHRSGKWLQIKLQSSFTLPLAGVWLSPKLKLVSKFIDPFKEIVRGKFCPPV